MLSQCEQTGCLRDKSKTTRIETLCWLRSRAGHSVTGRIPVTACPVNMFLQQVKHGKDSNVAVIGAGKRWFYTRRVFWMTSNGLFLGLSRRKTLGIPRP
jgi:hypothetical protein